MDEPRQRRDWQAIRTLSLGWGASAFCFVLGAVLAIWCLAALLIGSAVLLARIFEWAV